MGNELLRPLEYMLQAGSSETDVRNQYNTGGNVTGTKINSKIRSVDLISISNFDSHLQNKGVPAQAITYFAVLKHVQNGAREHMEFQLRRDNATLEKIGVAVRRVDPNQANVAIVWDQFVVQFAAPNIVTNYVTRNYGFGYRQSDQHSTTTARGLTQPELDNIKSTLNTFANSHNLALTATNSL